MTENDKSALPQFITVWLDVLREAAVPKYGVSEARWGPIVEMYDLRYCDNAERDGILPRMRAAIERRGYEINEGFTGWRIVCGNVEWLIFCTDGQGHLKFSCQMMPML